MWLPWPSAAWCVCNKAVTRLCTNSNRDARPLQWGFGKWLGGLGLRLCGRLPPHSSSLCDLVNVNHAAGTCPMLHVQVSQYPRHLCTRGWFFGLRACSSSGLMGTRCARLAPSWRPTSTTSTPSPDATRCSSCTTSRCSSRPTCAPTCGPTGAGTGPTPPRPP